MKKLLCFIGLFPALFASKSHASIPGGTIPFIFDSHLYLQVRLNDTIPVTIIYDTGADFLYLDGDYLKLNNLQNAFGKKGTARMGGAGNNESQSVDIFIEPIKIHCGELDYQNKITPVIKLRDILGKHTDGLLGNTHLLNTPLEINFSESYIKQLKEPLSTDSLDRYHKLEARFKDNRIDVKANLQIDSANTVEGWFIRKAYFETQAGGIGGSSEEFELRAEKFGMVDTLENLVIDCSLNKKGALSSGRPYVGIIGNEIWSLYDIILDPVHSSVWVKRNDNEGSYSRSSVTHMAVIDRTDICEGWIINGLYKSGIAEQAGIEIGDIIIAINDRPVKEITWEEQRKGLGLNGKTEYTIKKRNGEIVTCVLYIRNQII